MRKPTGKPNCSNRHSGVPLQNRTPKQPTAKIAGMPEAEAAKRRQAQLQSRFAGHALSLNVELHSSPVRLKLHVLGTWYARGPNYRAPFVISSITF